MGATLSNLTEGAYANGGEAGPGLGDIPESCVACVFMHLTPPEICNLARLNRAFRGAASADSVWESKLPDNYDALLRKLPADHPALAADPPWSKKNIFALLSRSVPFDDASKFCLQSASNNALIHNKGFVMYFDTCNSFSTKRILGMIKQNSHFAIIEESRERNLQSVMCRILCHSVFDIFTLFDVLQQLACSLENQVIIDEDKIHLLVVDSLSSLITPILGGRNSNGRSLMIIVGFLLKKLAHEHGISVLFFSLKKEENDFAKGQERKGSEAG